jgi:hypothetical protein
MPKKTWANKSQMDWLASQLPEFRSAQESKTVPDFFSRLYAEYYKQWPLPAPTSQEIAEAEGDKEKAKTAKQKANESVSNYFVTMAQKLIYIYIYVCKQTHNWIYNKSRPNTSGTGSRAVLRLKATTRLLHPWQAFSKLRGEQLKPKVDDEWEKYVEANPTAGHSPGEWFNFRNQKMQEWYNKLDDEERKQVEEYRQKYKDGSVDDEDKGGNKNRLLQK